MFSIEDYNKAMKLLDEMEEIANNVQKNTEEFLSSIYEQTEYLVTVGHTKYPIWSVEKTFVPPDTHLTNEQRNKASRETQESLDNVIKDALMKKFTPKTVAKSRTTRFTYRGISGEIWVDSDTLYLRGRVGSFTCKSKDISEIFTFCKKRIDNLCEDKNVYIDEELEGV